MVWSIPRIVLAALAAVAASVLLANMIGAPDRSEAALVVGGAGAQVLIGKDDDNLDNPVIQPPDTTANQSLNNTDVLLAGAGNDVQIGLLGSDVMQGERGRDIQVGGTEQGTSPNSDVMFGGPDNDTNIWAPGDGSDFFHGAQGTDALVFGVIDRGVVGNVPNVPILSDPVPGFPNGVPTANVSGSPGFCTLERIPPAPQSELGYDFLVRFFARSTGTLLVTIRVEDTEQVFCTSQAGGAITFANLTRANPQFVEVSLDQVGARNSDVRQIIR